MRVLIAPDKFKGSLSALEVCQAIGDGLQQCNPSIETIYHPMADGGDGSLAAIANHLELTIHDVRTTDPLGREMVAQYYTSQDTAFIEVASASGLVLLAKNERNPLASSTAGTGKIMLDAIGKGIKKFYLFLGGSATNDAGMGIASALGCQFLDEHNKVLDPIGKNLRKVKSIKTSDFGGSEKIQITLLCDVTNTLYGPSGAAHVYAAQKGASDEQIEYLDKGLRHFSNIIQKQFGIDVSEMPGIGAAGGIAASLIPIFGAKTEKGFNAIAELTGLEANIQSSDIIISGEGKLDTQSLQGKVIDGIATLCKKYKKTLVLFVGKTELTEQERHLLEAKYIYAIANESKSLEDAISNGADYLSNMAIQYCWQLTH